MRIVERLLSLIVALGFVFLAILVPVEVVQGLLHHHEWLFPRNAAARAAQRERFEFGSLRTILIIAVVVGLLLLLVALKRRRVTRLPLTEVTPGVDAAIGKRALSHTLARAATGVDGIASAKAKVKRRSVSLKVTSRLHAPDGLQEQVQQRAEARIAQLTLKRAPRVRVRVKSKG